MFTGVTHQPIRRAVPSLIACPGEQCQRQVLTVFGDFMQILRFYNFAKITDSQLSILIRALADIFR